MNQPNSLLKVDSPIRHFIEINFKGVCKGISHTHTERISRAVRADRDADTQTDRNEQANPLSSKSFLIWPSLSSKPKFYKLRKSLILPHQNTLSICECQSFNEIHQ
jgi:hypothetical protein